MEMMFVMGKRTRLCCQATGSAAPVPMAANTSAEAGLEEGPTWGCLLLGGPHHPMEPRGWDSCSLRGPHRWGDRAVSPPLPTWGSLSGGQSSEESRQDLWGTFCPASGTV